MCPRRGIFILFEGGDCTGKTTQSQLLAERFGSTNAQYIKFPLTDSASTRFIRNYLTLQNDDTLVSNRVSLQSLFTQQRFASQSTIATCLNNNKHLIVDRYSYSGIVYSHALIDNFEQVKFTENYLIQPDLVFLLSCDPIVAHERKPYADRFETNTFQQKIRHTFLQLHKYYTQHVTSPPLWTLLDTTETDTKSIHEQIWQITNNFISNNTNLPIQLQQFNNLHLPT